VGGCQRLRGQTAEKKIQAKKCRCDPDKGNFEGLDKSPIIAVILYFETFWRDWEVSFE
jgi:hypothetical protein